MPVKNAELERGAGRERASARLRRGDRVERDQQREVRPRRPRHQPLAKGRERDHDEHSRRRAPPPQERHRQQRREQPAGPALPPARDQLHARDRQQPQCDQHVERDRVAVHQRADVAVAAHRA
jgi:hypothetical protein